MTEPAGGARHAIVGRVRRAHGVQGELVVELLTDAPDVIFASGARVLGGTVRGDLARQPVELHVAGARPFKDGLLVFFDEVSNREEAEQWRERYLLVPADELVPPGDDEVFRHQLVGLTMELENGTVIGRVVGYYEMSNGLLLEIARGGGTELMPYRAEFVRVVDLEEKRLVVDPPEGLFE